MFFSKHNNDMSEPLLLTYIKAQKKMGFSPIILFVGRQRVGKTAMAIWTACQLKPSWDVRKFMTYRIENFADIYDKSNNEIIILDEAGISLDPYEHASITQRVYNHIVQTQAYKSNIVFLVLPFASEIGKQHRKHVNAIVNVVWRGVYTLYATNTWHPDLSNKPPRLSLIETVRGVPLPPKDVWEYYTQRGQMEYKQSILDMQMTTLKLMEKKKSGGGRTGDDDALYYASKANQAAQSQ